MASRKLLRIPGVNPTLTSRLRKVDRHIEALAPGYKEKGKDYVVRAVKNKAGEIIVGADGSQKPPKQKPPLAYIPNNPYETTDSSSSSSTGTFAGKKLVDTNDSYALSKAPNPKKVSLNSGIFPNTFVNDFMTPVENRCAPLHVTGFKFVLPTAANNPLTSYLMNTTLFDIQTAAQDNVSFGLDVTTLFSTTNIRTALSYAIDAFSCLFYYKSILSYESDPRNKNAGMINLRSQIDGTLLSDIGMLEKRCMDLPLPPRIIELLRYLYGTYHSGDSQGSPLIKFIPDTTWLTGITPGSTPYKTGPATCIANLNTMTVQYSLLRTCFKKWRSGTIWDVPPTPRYDKNFMTIFANANNVNYGGGAGAQIPNTATAINIAIPYNSYTNNLDGLGFALTNIWVTGSLNTYIPGLTSPTTTDLTNYKDNRFSYYIVGSTTGWYPVASYPFLGSCRPETALTQLGVTTYPHTFGTDRCQNVTGEALLQSGQAVIDFLFDASTTSSKMRTAQFRSNR